MTEELLPGIFRMEIPIPRSPLKATNSYVIKGKERNLLIDTGQNCQPALNAIRQGLEKLEVDMKKTDIFLTHMHADHWGLTQYVKTDSSVIYVSEKDGEIINILLTADSPLDSLIIAACRNGFIPSEAKKAIERHPGNDPGEKAPLKFNLVTEGTVIAVGGYNLKCIETPGHTDGHVCLYEQERKILFSGDHILGDITPNITWYRETGNPLGAFLKSLKKVVSLPVDMVLPGHRRFFTDCQKRITELEEHHRHRLAEVYAILSGGPLNGYEVAARMTWDMVFNSWDEVAPAQKFFATGEALSHLRHLECEKLVERCCEGDQIVFRRL